MTWRRKGVDLEADLFSVPPPRFIRVPKGEAEYEAYDDGRMEFELFCWGLKKIPDGCMVTVRIQGVQVYEVQITRGRGRLDLRSD